MIDDKSPSSQSADEYSSCSSRHRGIRTPANPKAQDAKADPRAFRNLPVSSQAPGKIRLPNRFTITRGVSGFLRINDPFRECQSVSRSIAWERMQALRAPPVNQITRLAEITTAEDSGGTPVFSFKKRKRGISDGPLLEECADLLFASEHLDQPFGNMQTQAVSLPACDPAVVSKGRHEHA